MLLTVLFKRNILQRLDVCNLWFSKKILYCDSYVLGSNCWTMSPQSTMCHSKRFPFCSSFILCFWSYVLFNLFSLCPDNRVGVCYIMYGRTNKTITFLLSYLCGYYFDKSSAIVVVLLFPFEISVFYGLCHSWLSCIFPCYTCRISIVFLLLLYVLLNADTLSIFYSLLSYSFSGMLLGLLHM